MSQLPSDGLTDVEQAAVTNLRLARRHARTTERLAVALLILGIVAAFILCASDALGQGLVTAIAAVVAWALLRSAALTLHMRVDRTLLNGD